MKGPFLHCVHSVLFTLVFLFVRRIFVESFGQSLDRLMANGFWETFSEPFVKYFYAFARGVSLKMNNNLKFCKMKNMK